MKTWPCGKKKVPSNTAYYYDNRRCLYVARGCLHCWRIKTRSYVAAHRERHREDQPAKKKTRTR